MKRTNTIYTLLALMLVMFLAACHKDEKIGGTAVQTLAGEYWVKLDGGTGEFGDSYYTLSLYNTAANKPDSIWIDDDLNSKPFWQIKGKIGCSVSNLTFSGSNVVNQDYDSHFTVTNGKIIKNAATAPGTKLKTDSISFDIQFDDEDPVVVHKVGGYARTKFDADDHY